MPIRVVPHAREHTPAVEAFNARMAERGSPYGFYPEPEPDWVPPRPGQSTWREYLLAIDDADGSVRGAFALKPHVWLVNGAEHVVTDWQGPFSEGAVDPRYSALGLRLLREMLKRRPALYSWGHGGNEQPIVELLGKMGWVMHPTPLCLRVCKPFRFLRHNAYLRRRRSRRLLLDLLAWTGVGSVGVRLLQAARRGRSRAAAVALEVPDFGPWADELWTRCRGAYRAIALRDRATMNALTPAGKWPPVVRLKVERAGGVVGWALVMDTQMRGDHRYGDLRVGSIVDCFADPADAAAVVQAASRFLERRGVDLIASNQAHPDWVEGFRRSGYVVLPDKRLFAPSPALRELLDPFDATAAGLHLTNMDGHGPMAF